MSTYKEWRAVGVDVVDDCEVYEPGNWRGAKADARREAAAMKRSSLPYARVILQRRKVSEPVEVKA